MGNDNASGALKFAVGLVVTMILIGIVIVAFSFARSHANNAISSTSKDVSQIEESRYTMYDGATVTGAEVLNLITKFKDDNIAISVKTAAVAASALPTTAGSDGTFYIKDAYNSAAKQTVADLNTKLREAKDPSKADKYINPSSDYYGLVYYDTTSGAIQGIYFVRVEG